VDKVIPAGGHLVPAHEDSLFESFIVSLFVLFHLLDEILVQQLVVRIVALEALDSFELPLEENIILAL
jgi:hypothetical protein